jgi:hypothetical protein
MACIFTTDLFQIVSARQLWRLQMKVMFAILCSLAASCSISQAATSIIGKWDFSAEKCRLPIHISAMSMVHADVNCQFSSVKRRGNTVTWLGICEDDEGTSQETVTARLDRKGRLTISYGRGGNVLRNLVRCR